MTDPFTHPQTLLKPSASLLPTLRYHSINFPTPNLKRISIPTSECVFSASDKEPHFFHSNIDAFMLKLLLYPDADKLLSVRLEGWSALNYRKPWVRESAERLRGMIDAYSEVGLRLENDDGSLVAIPESVWEKALDEYVKEEDGEDEGEEEEEVEEKNAKEEQGTQTDTPSGGAQVDEKSQESSKGRVLS
jgi:hypothetical protein